VEAHRIGALGWVTSHPFTTLTAIALGVMGIFAVSRRSTEWDEIFLRSAQLLIEGKNIYRDMIGFTYPPFPAWVSIPFAFLPVHLARGLWFILCAGSLVYLMKSSWRLAGGRPLEPGLGTPAVPGREIVASLIGQVIALQFALNALTHLQADLPIAAMLMAGCAAIGAERFMRGATWIGLAAAFKATPLLFAPYLLWRRQWRAAAWLVIVSIGVNLLPNTVHSPPGDSGERIPQGAAIGTAIKDNGRGDAITLFMPADGGKTDQQTFVIDKRTKITADGRPASLSAFGGLAANARIFIQPTAASDTIAATIAAVGPEVRGQVSAENKAPATITLQRSDGSAKRDYSIGSGTSITIDGSPGTLDGVTAGDAARIQLSAVDGSTVVDVEAIHKAGSANLAGTPAGGLWLTRWYTQYLKPMGSAKYRPGDWKNQRDNNQAVAGAINRWTATTWSANNGEFELIDRPEQDQPNPLLMKGAFGVCCLAMLLPVAWAEWARRRVKNAGLPGAQGTPNPAENPNTLDYSNLGAADRLPTPLMLECGIVFLLMLLFSPNSSRAHFCIMYLPAFCVARLAVRPSAGKILIALLALAAICSTLSIHVRLPGSQVPEQLMLWVGVVMLSAFFLLLATCRALAGYPEDTVASVGSALRTDFAPPRTD